MSECDCTAVHRTQVHVVGSCECLSKCILFHVYTFIINNNSNSCRIRILELELYTMNVHLGTHRSQLLGSCAAVLQCMDVVLVGTGLIY